MTVLNKSETSSDPGGSSVFPAVILGLLTIPIIYTGFAKLFKKRSPTKGRDLSEIVRLRQYLRFNLPPLLDGLVGVYNVKTYGTRIVTEWWKSTDYAGMARIELPFHSPAICVMNPELIKKVLGSGELSVLNKPKIIYDVMFPNMLINGLLASRVEIWQPHRKLLNRFFTYSSLHGHLKVLNKYGQALISEIGQEGNVKEELLSAHLYDNLLKVILEVLMGPDNVSSKNGTSEFVENFRQLKPLLVYRLLHPLNLIPPVWWMNPVKKVHENTSTKANGYFLQAIDNMEKVERENKKNGEVDEDEHGLSALQHMFRSNFSREEIDSEVATLLTAGHETTYGALGFLLQHLAEHPEIQERCHEEIDSVFSSDEISMEDLSNLKYLERCVYESLRISPTVPLVSRQLTAPLELDGFHLEKGTIVVVPSWLLHRDPEIYPEAEKFDPDRFLPEAVKARHPYSYMPFSLGPRNCIGWKMAMMEMKIFLCYLLRDYNVETTDKFGEMKLEFEVTLVPERNFNTTLKRRQKN